MKATTAAPFLLLTSPAALLVAGLWLGEDPALTAHGGSALTPAESPPSRSAGHQTRRCRDAARPPPRIHTTPTARHGRPRSPPSEIRAKSVRSRPSGAPRSRIAAATITARLRAGPFHVHEPRGMVGGLNRCAIA